MDIVLGLIILVKFLVMGYFAFWIPYTIYTYATGKE